MGYAQGVALAVLISSFNKFVFSEECIAAHLDAPGESETVQIYSNEYALDNGHVSYEISPLAPSNSFDQVSDSIRILTSNQSSCPSSCTVTLNRYTDASQGAESTVLFYDTDDVFYLPSHYVKDGTTTLVCVATNGSCGATVPIYRYYKISYGGVYHAYSFDQDVIYDGYNQEFLPICYAWAATSGTVASRPTCGALNFDIPPETLSNLNIYDNNQRGIERDHYYTTLEFTDPRLATYNQTGVLGRVLTSSKSTACSCLVKLQQQFDNQTGYFHRIDHKLIVAGKEPNRPYEEYVDTGEVVYCAKRVGDCGATLPLWKHFQFYDIDTVYSTDSYPLPLSYLYPQTPLCYIWPSNYSPNVSRIVTLPAASTKTTIGTVTTQTVAINGSATDSSTSQSDGNTAASTKTETGSTQSGSWSPSGSTALIIPSTTASAVFSNSSWETYSSSEALTTLFTVRTSSATSESTDVTLSDATTAAVLPALSAEPTRTSETTPSLPISTDSTTDEPLSRIPINNSTVGFNISSVLSTLGTTFTAATSSEISGGTMATDSTPLTTRNSGDLGTVTSDSNVSNEWIPTVPTTSLNHEVVVTDTYVETNGPIDEEFTPQPLPTPETFSLSEFWYVGASAVPPASLFTAAPTIPTRSTEPMTTQPTATLSGATPSSAEAILIPASTISSVASTAPVISEMNSAPSSSIADVTGTSETTPRTPVMLTGPIIFIIPTNAPPSIKTTSYSYSSSPSSLNVESLTPSSSLPMTTIQLTSSPATTASPAPFHLSTDTISNSTSSSSSTSTPQQVAQAAPSRIIIGGSLDSYTNPPVITVIINSSAASASEQTVQNKHTSLNTTATTVSSSEEPGVFWKAGDWISNAWNSVFGGSDQSVVTKASTKISSGDLVATTIRPMGGLVGTLINSTGNFFNNTKTFIGNTFDSFINSNSSSPVISFLNMTGNFINQSLHSNSSNLLINNRTRWINDKLNSTTDFFSSAFGSLKPNSSTSGNSTQQWIQVALNSTGEFVSKTWDTATSNNGTFPVFVNNTQTWIGGALNKFPCLVLQDHSFLYFSTDGFLTNAWKDQIAASNDSTGNIVNNTQTWVAGAINSTEDFLTNAWSWLWLSNSTDSIIDNTKTWVGNAVNSTDQFFTHALNETKEYSGNALNNSQTWISEQLNGASNSLNTDVGHVPSSIRSTETDNIELPSSPHSKEVEGVNTVIQPEIVKWNGGIVNGSIIR